jgi:hypothetical protein
MKEIENLYSYLQKLLRDKQLTILSNDYDLVLDILPTENGDSQWLYYYACHTSRCLFWLDSYDISNIIVPGAHSPAHISMLSVTFQI